jgi:hypothetical protein
MWLQTTLGFFSIVQKAGEAHLTVRARARGDLERLRDGYLPDLGPIREGEGTDYRYRATATHDAVAQAIGRLVMDITYPNFKNEVKRRMGPTRAATYGEVWQTLFRIHDGEAP